MGGRNVEAKPADAELRLLDQDVASDLAEINGATLQLLRHQPKLFDLVAKRAMLSLLRWVQAVRGRDRLKKLLRECSDER